MPVRVPASTRPCGGTTISAKPYRQQSGARSLSRHATHAPSAAHADGLQQWLVESVVVTAVTWQRLVRLSRRMPVDHDTVVAYLDRVGLTAPVVGDAAGLRTLHRAHQLTVPFENLSIHLSEPVSLDEA